MLADILLTGTLGFGLVALLIHEHANLVRGGQALDCLGREILVGVRT